MMFALQGGFNATNTLTWIPINPSDWEELAPGPGGIKRYAPTPHSYGKTYTSPYTGETVNLHTGVFSSAAKGRGCDNPGSVSTLTELQAQRALTFNFLGTDSEGWIHANLYMPY